MIPGRPPASTSVIQVYQSNPPCPPHHHYPCTASDLVVCSLLYTLRKLWPEGSVT